MRILIADENLNRSQQLEARLRAVGHEVVVLHTAEADLNVSVARVDPDVVLIDIDSPRRDSLEQIAAVHSQNPRPMVLLTHGDDVERLRAAVRAGVSAYVAENADHEHIRSIIEVAVAQFEEFSRIEGELAATRAKLSERKLVEKAKGLLMQQRGCSEDEAYRALRKLAMDQEQTVAEIAKSVVSVAGLLSGTRRY